MDERERVLGVSMCACKRRLVHHLHVKLAHGRAQGTLLRRDKDELGVSERPADTAGSEMRNKGGFV